MQAAALSPDGRRLYVIGESRVAAHETEQLAATALYTLTLWSQNVSRPAALAAGRDGVAIVLRGRQDSLALYAAEQGKRLADVSLDGYAEAIASGPRWRLGGSPGLSCPARAAFRRRLAAVG